MDLDGTFSRARETGIVKAYDAFYQKGNDALSVNEFCTLLYRMLCQERYRYFEGGAYTTDEPRSIRYMDYLDGAGY